MAVFTQPVRLGSHTQGVVLGLAAASVYAGGPTMIRAALLGGLDPWSLLLLRSTLGALLLLAFLLVARSTAGVWPPRRATLAGLLVGVVGYGVQLLLFTIALQRTSAALVVVLFSCFPIFVVLAEAVTGREPLTAIRATSVAIGALGISAVALTGGSVDSDALGVLAALGSGAACALMILGGDRLNGRLPPIPATFLMTLGAALLFVFLVPFVGFAAPRSGSSWLLLLGITVGPGAVGTLMMLATVQRVGPSLASILMTFEPVVGVAISWVALGEGLSAWQAVGTVAILAAIVIAQRTPRRPPVPPLSP